MLKSNTPAISIATNPSQQPLSKEQKAFNKLIKQIDAKRNKIAAWQEIMPVFQRKYSSEMEPLIKDNQEMEKELLRCLDRFSSQKGLTATERRKISGLASELAGRLLAECDDDSLKNIYNKHSGSDYDAEEAASLEGLKFLFEDALGVKLEDDTEISSLDDLLLHAAKHMEKQQSEHDANHQSEAELKAKRKKSARQAAKESQQFLDEQQSSQSIRELYRKLASSLHPDREPDPQERERKTALMQRINQANDQRNLLLLLELQLELEHIDQTTINNITESRLKHYNKILKEQLIELEHEIFQTEGMFKVQFGISPNIALTPAKILRQLDVDIASIQLYMRDLKKDLLAFHDIKTIKIWLKGFNQ